MSFILADLIDLAPILLLVMAGLLALIVDLYLGKGDRTVLSYVGLGGTILALLSAVALWPGQTPYDRPTEAGLQALTGQMKATGATDLAEQVERWKEEGGMVPVRSGPPIRKNLFPATETRVERTGEIQTTATTQAWTIRVDSFTIFSTILILIALLLVLFMGQGPAERLGIAHGEYHFLLLISAGSMICLAASEHLLLLFLAFETFSLCLYAMVGLKRRKDPGRARPSEASIKYFVLGAFSSAFMLYGMALLYGVNGTLYLPELFATQTASQVYLLIIGFALFLCGLAFKVGAVPFHWWVPDVYQGAPMPVTAFMASAVKVAGFAFLVRVAVAAFGAETAVELAWGGWGLWTILLWGICVLTILLGNLLALVQSNLKRLLAYSSVAHTGYALMAVVVASSAEGGTAEVLGPLAYYLAAYIFMNIGAFAVLAALGREEITFDTVRGLWRRRPFLVAAMAVCMISLAGIPPTAGFFGKFVVFRAAVDHGFVSLALLGVLGTLISVYYYFRVVIVMFLYDPEPETPDPDPGFDPWGVRVAAGLSAAALLLFGIFPDWLFTYSIESVRALF